MFYILVMILTEALPNFLELDRVSHVSESFNNSTVTEVTFESINVNNDPSSPNVLPSFENSLKILIIPVILISISVLTIIGIFLWFFLIFKPQRDREEIERQAKIKEVGILILRKEKLSTGGNSIVHTIPFNINEDFIKSSKPNGNQLAEPLLCVESSNTKS